METPESQYIYDPNVCGEGRVVFKTDEVKQAGGGEKSQFWSDVIDG